MSLIEVLFVEDEEDVVSGPAEWLRNLGIGVKIVHHDRFAAATKGAVVMPAMVIFDDHSSETPEGRRHGRRLAKKMIRGSFGEGLKTVPFLFRTGFEAAPIIAEFEGCPMYRGCLTKGETEGLREKLKSEIPSLSGERMMVRTIVVLSMDESSKVSEPIASVVVPGLDPRKLFIWPLTALERWVRDELGKGQGGQSFYFSADVNLNALNSEDLNLRNLMLLPNDFPPPNL
jgi:hypothetical protein